MSAELLTPEIAGLTKVAPLSRRCFMMRGTGCKSGSEITKCSVDDDLS